MSVNSLWPSWERHPDVFSNRCIARDLDVSISGSHFSFLVEYLLTLGIHSWKEKYGGFGEGFHLLWLCWLSGYLTASYPASFSPDRKDRCKSLGPVPWGWEKNMAPTGGISVWDAIICPKFKCSHILLASEVFPKKPTCLFPGIFLF